MNMKEFLETVPLYKPEKIDTLNRSEISLHCEKCGGIQNFECTDTNVNFASGGGAPPPSSGGTSHPQSGTRISSGGTTLPNASAPKINAKGVSHDYHEKLNPLRFNYCCKNCDCSEKYFVIISQRSKENPAEREYKKIGEYPPFGPPTPSEVISLFKPDKDNFRKGRNCEYHGFGIGAYAYYRRVVESQKNRIIDKLLEFCKLDTNNTKLVEQLEQAKEEIRFSNAMDNIKENLPEALFVNGQNPLKLLHKALSKGVHDWDDDDCLNRAEVISFVLAKLCLKINVLLGDEKEYENGIKAIHRLNSKDPSPKSESSPNA